MRNDVEMEVCEPFRLGEDDNVGLVASDDLAQRPRRVVQHATTVGCVLFRQLVECYYVTGRSTTSQPGSDVPNACATRQRPDTSISSRGGR